MFGDRQSRSGGAGAGDDCDGEDQEDSSSSSSSAEITHIGISRLTLSDQNGNNATNKPNEDELSSFRQQWKKELSSPVKSQNDLKNKLVIQKNNQNISQDTNDESIEEKAKRLFLKGVEHERNGKLYEAIQFYKKAVQLIPDIEFRLYESSQNKSRRDESPQKPQENSNSSEKNAENSQQDHDSDEDLSDGKLLIKLQGIVFKNGYFCETEMDQKVTHISALPTELILYILRWVVSGELDFASLESCAAVCRGFYLCARDQEIWRLACVKVWGINCGTLESFGFENWRQMYIMRPRLRFEGCYISKTSYFRHGDNCFQDQFYKPWYLIKYFRYLRFFPDGNVLMLTTADEPSMCVPYLKHRTSRAQGVLLGHYRLYGDKILIIIEKCNVNKQAQQSNTRFRPRRKDNAVEGSQSQTFHLELQIQAHHSRAFSALVWRRYTVCMKNEGRETSSNFDLGKSQFPPFSFSCVRSYNAETESLLQ